MLGLKALGIPFVSHSIYVVCYKVFPDLLAQTAIFVSSPGPCKFCFARAFWLIATNSVGISSKEKRLTGLHQNQNFGQVALEFYLAEALSNLPEFGSEQTMKYETTSRLPKWNSPLTLANWFHSMVPFCKYRAKSRRDMRIWKKTLTITSTISRLGAECQGRAKFTFIIICPVEMKK